MTFRRELRFYPKMDQLEWMLIRIKLSGSVKA